MPQRRLKLILSGAAVILVLGACGVSNLVSQPIGKQSMNIQVSLTLGRTSLIAGEQTQVTVKVVNTSKETITLHDVKTSPKWPKLRLRDMQTGKEVTYGPGERPDPHADDFVPVMPPTTVQLASGQSIERSEDLNAWFGPLTPGRYELVASAEYAESAGKSAVTQLKIEPAMIESAYTVGPDSAKGQFRNTFWTAQHIGLMTLYSFDSHGHAQVSQSKRFLETDKPLRLIPSVTPNGLPYPSQWLAALDGQTLHTIFLKQGTVTSPLRANHLDIAGPAAIVGPVLLDLEGNDGSRPGRGLVPIWQDGLLRIFIIQADGSVQHGPEFPIEQGELRWGSSGWLSKGERRFTLAISRGGNTVVRMLRWTGGSAAAPVRIGEFPGDAMAGGATLATDDRLHCGIVLRSGNDYRLQSWAVEPNASVNIKQPNKLEFAMPENIQNAKVSMSAAGQPFVLLANAKQQWFWSLGKGIVNGIRQELAKTGQPIDAFWLYETEPLIVLASPDRGIVYRPLR